MAKNDLSLQQMVEELQKWAQTLVNHCETAKGDLMVNQGRTLNETEQLHRKVMIDRWGDIKSDAFEIQGFAEMIKTRLDELRNS